MVSKTKGQPGTSRGKTRPDHAGIHRVDHSARRVRMDASPVENRFLVIP